MTGDESGDLALALGLFAFLFTVGLCIILRKVPHFVWKRLTDPKESLYAVSSQRKLKKAPSRLRQGVKRRLNSRLSEVVQTARYVTHHPSGLMTHHHPSIAHRSPSSSFIPRSD